MSAPYRESGAEAGARALLPPTPSRAGRVHVRALELRRNGAPRRVAQAQAERELEEREEREAAGQEPREVYDFSAWRPLEERKATYDEVRRMVLSRDRTVVVVQKENVLKDLEALAATPASLLHDALASVQAEGAHPPLRGAGAHASATPAGSTRREAPPPVPLRRRLQRAAGTMALRNAVEEVMMRMRRQKERVAAAAAAGAGEGAGAEAGTGGVDLGSEGSEDATPRRFPEALGVRREAQDGGGGPPGRWAGAGEDTVVVDARGHVLSGEALMRDHTEGLVQRLSTYSLANPSLPERKAKMEELRSIYDAGYVERDAFERHKARILFGAADLVQARARWREMVQAEQGERDAGGGEGGGEDDSEDGEDSEDSDGVASVALEEDVAEAEKAKEERREAKRRARARMRAAAEAARKAAQEEAEEERRRQLGRSRSLLKRLRVLQGLLTTMDGGDGKREPAAGRRVASPPPVRHGL